MTLFNKNIFQPKSLQQRTILFILIPIFLFLTLAGVLGFFAVRKVLIEQWGETAVAGLERAAHNIDMQLNRPKQLLFLMKKTLSYIEPGIGNSYYFSDYSFFNQIKQILLEAESKELVFDFSDDEDKVSVLSKISATANFPDDNLRGLLHNKSELKEGALETVLLLFFSVVLKGNQQIPAIGVEYFAKPESKTE